MASGISYLPPWFNSAVFNSSAFNTGNYITKAEGDRLYLQIAAGVNLPLIEGITPGLAIASKALILDSSKNITGQNNITYLGTCSGPVLSLSSSSGGDMLTLTTSTTTARNTIKFVTDAQTFEIGSRASAATNGNNFYIYNTAYRFLMNPSGDVSLLSTTDTTSSTTGSLKLSGGMAIAKKSWFADTMTLDRNGSQLVLSYLSQNALIEVPASPDVLRLVRGHAVNIGTNGVTIASASIAAARYTIDLQATAADIKLCLFQSASNGTYGIGANGSRLIMCSGGQGHSFYKSNTGGSLGTLQAEIDTDSNFIASNNLISGTGAFFRQGFSSAGRTNTGLAMHMANSVYAEIFAYNYASPAFKDILVADTLLVQGGVKNCGIGIANPSSDIIAYPFVVNKTVSSSISGAYGYLATGGAGSSSGTGSVPVSIYCSGRVFATEFDAYSDQRLKKNITKIDPDQVDKFIELIEPVEFEWKNEDSGKRTGFIAQQLLKIGLFEDLVTMHVDDKMVQDEDSPEGYSLAVQYNNFVAILTQAIKNQRKQIKKNEEDIARLLSIVDRRDEKGRFAKRD